MLKFIKRNCKENENVEQTDPSAVLEQIINYNDGCGIDRHTLGGKYKILCR